MAVDIETRRLKDHTNIVQANQDEEMILDSSSYGTRNISIENFTRQILGNNNISEYGDGTPTGAIVNTNERLDQTNNRIGDANISGYADGTITGILANFATMNVLIPANGWSDEAPYHNTINVAGITALDKIICLGYVPSNDPAENILISHAASRIDYGITNEDTITWYCLELKPEIDITMTIMRGY